MSLFHLPGEKVRLANIAADAVQWPPNSLHLVLHSSSVEVTDAAALYHPSPEALFLAFVSLLLSHRQRLTNLGQEQDWPVATGGRAVHSIVDAVNRGRPRRLAPRMQPASEAQHMSASLACHGAAASVGRTGERGKQAAIRKKSNRCSSESGRREA